MTWDDDGTPPMGTPVPDYAVIGEPDPKGGDWLWLFWVVAIVAVVVLVGWSVVNGYHGIGGIPDPVSGPGLRTHS